MDKIYPFLFVIAIFLSPFVIIEIKGKYNLNINTRKHLKIGKYLYWLFIISFIPFVVLVYIDKVSSIFTQILLYVSAFLIVCILIYAFVMTIRTLILMFRAKTYKNYETLHLIINSIFMLPYIIYFFITLIPSLHFDIEELFIFSNSKFLFIQMPLIIVLISISFIFFFMILFYTIKNSKIQYRFKINLNSHAFNSILITIGLFSSFIYLSSINVNSEIVTQYSNTLNAYQVLAATVLIPWLLSIKNNKDKE